MDRSEIVEGWLGIATRDLCPAAKERIALEIKAHFGEAVAAQVAEGKSLAVAELVAIDQLGDPETAGKRFRKRHLTVKEFAIFEKHKDWLLKPHSWKLHLLNFVSIPAMLFLMVVVLKSRKQFIYFCLGLYVFSLIIHPLTRNFYRSLPDDKLLRRLSSVTLISSAVIILLAVIFLRHLRDGEYVAMFCFMGCMNAYRWLPIFLKSTKDRS